ncbi:MAG: lysine-sensitive aspartokinase 3 [Spirochaetales bacterium]
MIVLKFGGSSVRDAGMIERVLEIVSNALDEAPLLVSSAMGKTTDALVAVSAAAVSGHQKQVGELLDALWESHRKAVEDLCRGERREETVARVRELFDELRGLAHGVSLIRECSPRTADALLSFGERLSTTVIAAAALERGIDATLVDARTLIATNDAFGAAAPDMVRTTSQVQRLVKPAAGKLVVTQGFIGSHNGLTTTLGRGGSDFTATILGAALRADRVEIWTDVNGIMTADPRIIPSARSLDLLSYDEAAELAYFGAKVVHPSTITPAVEQRIPVIVRNTAEPRAAGTTIGAGTGDAGVRAIASKSDVTLVTVESSRMLNAFGFLHALFEVFDQHSVSVDLIATSEVSVSMTVDETVSVGPLVRDLEKLGTVSVEREKSIICIVGRGMLQSSEFLSGVFASIAPTPIRLISLGSSDINLSIVVSQEAAKKTLTALHDHLFPGR